MNRWAVGVCVVAGVVTAGAYAVLRKEALPLAAQLLQPQIPTGQSTRIAEAIKSDATSIRSEALQAAESTANNSIGSEGYGPHIQQIAASGNAQQAFEALGWMQGCKRNTDQQVEVLYQIRGMSPGPAGAALNRLIEQTQVEVRRCQTVTPEIAALQLPLALRALQGRIPGAAPVYAELTQLSPPAEYQPLLLAQLEADAHAASQEALRVLLQNSDRLGLSPTKVATYYAAYQLVKDAPAPFVGFMDGLPDIAAPSSIGQADTDEARAIAHNILKTYERLRPRRG